MSNFNNFELPAFDSQFGNIKILENFENFGLNDENQSGSASVSSGGYSPESSPRKTQQLLQEQIEVSTENFLNGFMQFQNGINNQVPSNTCKTALRTGYQIVRVNKKRKNNKMPEISWVDNGCFKNTRYFYNFKSCTFSKETLTSRYWKTQREVKVFLEKVHFLLSQVF